jgi:hypothetical protein
VTLPLHFLRCLRWRRGHVELVDLKRRRLGVRARLEGRPLLTPEDFLCNSWNQLVIILPTASPNTVERSFQGLFLIITEVA